MPRHRHNSTCTATTKSNARPQPKHAANHLIHHTPRVDRSSVGSMGLGRVCWIDLEIAMANGLGRVSKSPLRRCLHAHTAVSQYTARITPITGPGRHTTVASAAPALRPPESTVTTPPPPRFDFITPYASGMTAPSTTPRRRPAPPLALLLLLLLHAMPFSAAAVTTTRLAAALSSSRGSSARAAFLLGTNFCAPRTVVPGRPHFQRRAVTAIVMNAAGGEQQAEGVGEAPSFAAAPQPSSTSGGGLGGGMDMDFFRTGLPPIPFPKEPQITPSSPSSSTASSSSSSTKKKGSSSSKKRPEKPSLPPQPLPPGIAGALPNKSGTSNSGNSNNSGDKTITSSSGTTVNIPGGVFGNSASSSPYSSTAYRNPGLFPTHPRAAVAVTIATKPSAFDKTIRYCLVKRSKDPGKGQWSLPGGSIELGEETLRAAAREAEEETGLTKDDLRFYPYTICTTDAIYRASDSESSDAAAGEVKFHYLIAQHAAWINSGAVERAKAGDDAEELKFCTLDEIKAMTLDGSLVGNVVDVVLRVEKFVGRGVINLDFDLVELQ